jgi:REP element-mobilizing transposase RayT
LGQTAVPAESLPLARLGQSASAHDPLSTDLKTGWQVQAYCLMRNHFHLVVETPQANLVTGMKWSLGTHTGRFNRRHKLFGHLFSGRYKALIMEGGGSGYLRTACEYIHLNPVRAKLINDDSCQYVGLTRDCPVDGPNPPQGSDISTMGRKKVWLCEDLFRLFVIFCDFLWLSSSACSG